MSKKQPERSSRGQMSTITGTPAVGVPVVTTAVSGLPDAVIHGRTGLLVPEHDPEALAAAIERLLTRPRAGPRLAAEARGHVESSFALERSAARLRTLFPEVA